MQAFTESFTSTTGSGGASSGLAGKRAEDVARPVHEKMREIFKDGPDLLEKFESFLPGREGAQMKQATANLSRDPVVEIEAEEVD